MEYNFDTNESIDLIELVNKAEALDEKKNFKASSKLWRRIIDLNKNNNNDRSSLQLPYVNLAKTLISLEQYSEASEILEEGIKLVPNTLGLLILHARLAQAQKYFKVAIQRWEKVRQKNPKHKASYFQAAKCCLKINELEKAQDLYSLGLSHFPNDSQLISGLAQLYETNGHLEEALEKWRLIESQSPEYRQAIIHKGELLMNLGKWSEAKKLYKDSIKKYPKGKFAYTGLAKLFEKQNDFVNALKLWDDILNRFPNMLTAHLRKGLIYLKMGELGNAKNWLIKYLNVRPDSIDALQGLGMTLEFEAASTTDLPWTGERYMPSISGEIMLEHVHRYLIATKFIKAKRVLDIASGEGYGSQLMAQLASSVIGVDIDPNTVIYSKKKYKNKNLSFLTGSCSQIPIKDNSVDVVVSFETIEHHDEHIEMFEEITRVLDTGGMLILSSPNKLRFEHNKKHQNQFHEKELDRDELVELAHRHFKHVVILEQRVQYGSMIQSSKDSKSIGKLHVAFVQSKNTGEADQKFDYEGQSIYERHDKPKFFILIASNDKIQDVNKIDSSSFTMNINQSRQFKHLSKGYQAFVNLEKKNREQKINSANHTMLPVSTCTFCGSKQFELNDVLWKDLIDTWEISPYEVSYINRQQGLKCTSCNANLRSMVIAKAMMNHFNYKGEFKQFIRSGAIDSLSLLEINKAGALHKYLLKLPLHNFGEFPEVNMMELKFDDNTFDIIVHTDTLEHVPDPKKGLEECYRVLKPGGSLFFTVPIIVDRLTRNRKGLTKSYHGSELAKPDDYVVHTEYGSDVWKSVIESGFNNCSFTTIAYPQAIAISASKY